MGRWRAESPKREVLEEPAPKRRRVGDPPSQELVERRKRLFQEWDRQKNSLKCSSVAELRGETLRRGFRQVESPCDKLTLRMALEPVIQDAILREYGDRNDGHRCLLDRKTTRIRPLDNAVVERSALPTCRIVQGVELE